MESTSEQLPGRLRVPLFPLPNVVLFPKAILPLHIFEDRYRKMTADVLAGDSRIAMALLRPGWEKDYYSRPPIEPVVCIGRIVAHEKLADGKYNLLLQGQLRAEVLRENSRGEGAQRYRVGELSPLPQVEVMEIDLTEERRRLIRMFGEPAFRDGVGRQFARLLAGPILTAEVADLLAFNYLDDVTAKQSCLADRDVRRRVGRVVSALEDYKTRAPAAHLSPLPHLDVDASLN
jgi:Lon protease-like protein